MRGEPGELIEEVLEIGAVLDEVLDLVYSAEGFSSEEFFGKEHGALSPGGVLADVTNDKSRPIHRLHVSAEG